MAFLVIRNGLQYVPLLSDICTCMDTMYVLCMSVNMYPRDVPAIMSEGSCACIVSKLPFWHHLLGHCHEMEFVSSTVTSTVSSVSTTTMTLTKTQPVTQTTTNTLIVTATPEACPPGQYMVALASIGTKNTKPLTRECGLLTIHLICLPPFPLHIHVCIQTVMMLVGLCC